MFNLVINKAVFFTSNVYSCLNFCLVHWGNSLSFKSDPFSIEQSHYTVIMLTH